MSHPTYTPDSFLSIQQQHSCRRRSNKGPAILPECMQGLWKSASYSDGTLVEKYSAKCIFFYKMPVHELATIVKQFFSKMFISYKNTHSPNLPCSYSLTKGKGYGEALRSRSPDMSDLHTYLAALGDRVLSLFEVYLNCRQQHQ